jgi:hypothetical protein
MIRRSDRNVEVLQFASSEAPTYLNHEGGKKFRQSGWLISTIPCEINHLRNVDYTHRSRFRRPWLERYNHGMYHYNPSTALEELTEEATLPNPVHVRDMILRRKLNADRALEMNRIFLEYQKFFGETQKLGKEILKKLADQ